MTDQHTLGRVLDTAFDDVAVTLPAHTRELFTERVAELLELDREQRHQARRVQAADALFYGEKQ